MSYARFDDRHDEGRLSRFRERLAAEVGLYIGEEFAIFQDRNDIHWGQSWQERIEGALDAVTFLIPIITPSFFASPACEMEVTRFREREQRLGRNDLILPVYYIECPLFDDEAARAEHSVAELVARHQYVDWRDMRFDRVNSRRVGRRLADLARQIRDALQRVDASP
jgi:F-box protein 11